MRPRSAPVISGHRDTLRVARGLAVAALTAAMIVVGGPPAWADPAGPTNYLSELDAIVFTDNDASAEADAEQPSVEIEIVGGDAYLVLRNLGSDVLVPGYEGEPYLRFEPDGRVLVNDRSPARWLNDARFGAVDVEVPAGASAAAEPSWRLIATGGEWSWHDHRIHFMSPVLPPQVDTSLATAQPVLEWEIPFEVDGRPAAATGQLRWVPGPNPLVPVGLLVLAVAGAAVLAWRGTSATIGATAATAALMFGIGAAAVWSMPTGADVEPALLVLPGVALAVLVVARYFQRRGDGRASVLLVGAGVPVGTWGVVQIGALTRPIVPGPVPTPVVAFVVAAALAVGAASVVSLGRSALAATRVEVD